MSEEKLHPICSKCKGKNVEMREYMDSTWNTDTKSWDKDEAGYESHEYCNACGADYRMEWVSLKEHNAAPYIDNY